MKRAIAVFLWVLIAGLALAEPVMTLKNIKGKVEVKQLGKSWLAATEGMKIDKLATLSTGFDSTAVLVIDQNTIKLDPITRLTVDKIIEKAQTTSTSLHLRVGKVTAEVKTATGAKQDFKVTSPYSTASVLGTEFTFDGINLSVKKGRVRFIPGRPKRDIDMGGGGESELPTEEIQLVLQAEFPEDSFNMQNSDEGDGEGGSDAPPPGGFNDPNGTLVDQGQKANLNQDGSTGGGGNGTGTGTGDGNTNQPKPKQTGSITVTWD